MAAQVEAPIFRKLIGGEILTTLAGCIAPLVLGTCLLHARAMQNPASVEPPSQPAPSENPAPAAQSTEAKPESERAASANSVAPDTLPSQAWKMLVAGCENSRFGERAKAVRVLGLLPNDSRARKLAEKALEDQKPEVRLSAAAALGDMRSRASIPKLKKALDDSDISVALAAAHSLLTMHDKSGYEVYYEVLTQQRKATKGLIASHMATLHDPKKIALLGFEEGIGFVPFASIGWSAIKEIRSTDASPARAAAVSVLTEDRDEDTTKALINATQDNSWLVRAAALEALARRGDPSALGTVELGLNDEKDNVRFAAMAATVRLSTIGKARLRSREKKPSHE
jgi:HEAT repeat protein